VEAGVGCLYLVQDGTEKGIGLLGSENGGEFH
jgi:hypothetical protein